MIAAAYGSVEDIEILWTLIAIVGMFYSVLNLRESWLDWKYVMERDIRNGRRILAKSHLISEFLRFCMLGIFATLGFTAMFIPTLSNNPLTPNSVIIFGVVARWGLIACSIMLVAKTYIAKKTRDELRLGGGTVITTTTHLDEEGDANDAETKASASALEQGS